MTGKDDLQVKTAADKKKELAAVAKENKMTLAQLKAVKSLYPKLSADQIPLFLYECQRKGVSPLDRVISPLVFTSAKTGEKTIAFHTGIDYFRGQASASGEYGGQTEPEYLLADGKKKGSSELLPQDVEAIVSCTIGIFRKGVERPFIATAMMKSYRKTGYGAELWDKMPETMIAKCAEAQGFRKAFPKEFSGLYISDEVQNVVDADVIQPGNGKKALPDPAKDKKPELEVANVATGFQDKDTKKKGQPADQEKVVDAETVPAEPTLDDKIEATAKAKGMDESKIKSAWQKLGFFGSWRAGGDERKKKLLEVIG